MATAMMPLRKKGQTNCIHHKGRQLEFYCRKCQELLCPKCLSSLHNSHPICELSEITPQKKQDIKNFIDRTEQNDLVQIGKYITSTDTLFNDNDSAFEKLSHQLRMQTDKMKQNLDKLTAETLSLYQKMREDNTKLIQKYRQDLEMYDKQLKQQIQECKTALQQGSHIQIYDVSFEKHSCTSLPAKPVLCTASFTPNENPRGHLEQALGKVIPSGQGQTKINQEQSVLTSDDQRQFSTQNMLEDKGKKAATRNVLLPETKVHGQFYWSESNIHFLCPTADDQVWTSNYDDRTIYLLDRKGNVLQKVQHKAAIKDMSLSPKTHRLWVCDGDNNILELVSGQLTHRFKTKEKLHCLCVTASNHVILGSSKQICKVTKQGDKVLTSGAGKPSTPWKITECPVTHNVAVIDKSDKYDGGDGKKHVVVMDTDFQVLFVYRGDIPRTFKQTPQIGEPWDPSDCVVFDSVGNLIVGDYNNYRVLLLNGGGEFLGIINILVGHDKVDLYGYVVGVDRTGRVWTVIDECDNYNSLIKLLQYSSM